MLASPSSSIDHSVGFELTLSDLTPSTFTSDKQAEFVADLARSLGLAPHQVEIASWRAGSLVIQTRLVGIKTAEAAQAMAKKVQDKTSLEVLLSPEFGEVEVNNVATRAPPPPTAVAPEPEPSQAVSAREKAAAANKARRDKAAAERAQRHDAAKHASSAERTTPANTTEVPSVAPTPPNQALMQRPSFKTTKQSNKGGKGSSEGSGGDAERTTGKPRGRSPSALPSQGQRVVVKRRGEAGGTKEMRGGASRGGPGREVRRVKGVFDRRGAHAHAHARQTLSPVPLPCPSHLCRSTQ